MTTQPDLTGKDPNTPKKPSPEESLLRRLSSAIHAVEEAAADVSAVLEGGTSAEQENEYHRYHRRLVFEIDGRRMDGDSDTEILDWLRGELG